jgi:hypothetical protein
MENDPLAVALAQLKDQHAHVSADGVDHVSRADALIAKFEAEEKAASDAARKPAQMPPAARPGDSGLLPEPEPFSWGGAARAVGQQFVNEAKAIPAGINDAFSMGMIPAVQESEGGSLPPGTYQRTMDEGPIGATIGRTIGIGLSGGAGIAKPIGEGAQALASGLRRSGAYASPQVEKVIAPAMSAGAYSAADATVRGGTPDQVIDAGLTGAAMGASVPAVGAMSGAVGRKLFSRQPGPLVTPPMEVTPETIGIVKEPITAPVPYSVADKVQAKAMTSKAQDLLNSAVRRNAIKGTNKLGIVERQLSEAEAAKASDAAKLRESGMPIEIQGEEGGVSPAAKSVAAAAERAGLEKELLGPIPEFARKVLIKRNQIGEKIGQYTGAIEGEGGQMVDALPTPGVRMDALLKSLEKERRKSAPTTQRYKAITAEMDKLQESYSDSNVQKNMPHIPIWKVHDMAQDAAMKGYGVTPISSFDLKESQKIARDINRAYREPMYDEINRTLVRNPSYGSPESFAKLRQEYTNLSGLADIAMSARPQAYLGRPGLIESVKELGEKIKEHKIESGAIPTAAGIGYAMGGKTGAMLATALPAARPVANAVNTGLAKIIIAAREGATATAFNNLSSDLGINSGIAERIWRMYGAPAVGFTSSREGQPLTYQESPTR